MLRSILFFFVGISTFFTLNAQGQSKSKITIIPQAGFSISGQHVRANQMAPNEGYFKGSPKVSLELGGRVAYKLDEELSIVAGLAFIGRGSSYKREHFDGDFTDKLKLSLSLSLLQLPIGVVYNIGKTGFSLEGGLAPAIGLSGTLKYYDYYDEGRKVDVEAARIQFNTRQSNRANINRIDLGIYIGARKTILNNGLELGARLDYSIRNTAYDLDFTLRNYALTIFAAYPLGSN